MTPADLERMLRAVVRDEVRQALRDAQEAAPPRRRRARRDDVAARLGPLARAAFGRLGYSVWTVGDLVFLADEDPHVAEALAPWGLTPQRKDDALVAQRLGTWLAGLADLPADRRRAAGFELRDLGRSANVRVWSLAPVAAPEPPPGY